MRTRNNPRRPSLITFTAPEPEPTHDEIAQCARSIWEAAGRPEGRALEHWLLAEAQLRQWNQGITPVAKVAKKLPARPFSRNGSRGHLPDSVVL